MPFIYMVNSLGRNLSPTKGTKLFGDSLFPHPKELQFPTTSSGAPTLTHLPVGLILSAPSLEMINTNLKRLQGARDCFDSKSTYVMMSRTRSPKGLAVLPNANTHIFNLMPPKGNSIQRAIDNLLLIQPPTLERINKIGHNIDNITPPLLAIGALYPSREILALQLLTLVIDDMVHSDDKTPKMIRTILANRPHRQRPLALSSIQVILKKYRRTAPLQASALSKTKTTPLTHRSSWILPHPFSPSSTDPHILCANTPSRGWQPAASLLFFCLWLLMDARERQAGAVSQSNSLSPTSLQNPPSPPIPRCSCEANQATPLTSTPSGLIKFIMHEEDEEYNSPILLFFGRMGVVRDRVSKSRLVTMTRTIHRRRPKASWRCNDLGNGRVTPNASNFCSFGWHGTAVATARKT
ncbi:hypothetical protein BDK51DRAFT_27760 [Blyttiomyces helicus]|uniref:Uncharacterized protein n=1 Tax=Blyttiomyces helicus TaxID=388810 RepID=A0A4P9WDA6_9FUNG|nr:hypothetical protein BDK51DRAFT_27760 [Blyttiomyces helicus]|eukprot:RKO90661.1 hypothetical protein BDK51DRAFT_27760 [Blyttiomyces helicus]